MPFALTPASFASAANDFFHASKPAEDFPHSAASDAPAPIDIAKAAATSPYSILLNAHILPDKTSRPDTAA
jgi:hypothetical protein